MKILLFGSTGQLGRELQTLLSSTNETHALSSSQLDLQDLQKLKKIIVEIKPQLIVNASAYTAVDRAEQESELALRINAEAPAVMAESAKQINAAFIHYSTDYVFDGKKNTPYTENDLINPLNVYGKSKLKGEQAISQVGGAFVILRTSWVYSLQGDNFVTKILSWARQKKSMQIVTDQIGNPTWARALAQVTTALIEQSKPDIEKYFLLKSGIYHLGGRGSVSRFDFAQAILRLDTTGEHGAKKLIPALTPDFFTPAVRPLATALDCSKFENVFGLQLPNWEESLNDAMAGWVHSTTQAES